MKSYVIKLLAFLALIAALPASAAAAAAFNTLPISYIPQADHDLPMIDAKNITLGGAFSADQADHDDGVIANPGDIVEFLIYYHNSGGTDDAAYNVIIKAVLQEGNLLDHDVSAHIVSDQTPVVTSDSVSRGGNITIHVGSQPRNLEFIAGSTKHFPRKTAVGQTVSDGGNISTKGVNIGTVRGGFEFSGFVTFRARAGDSGIVGGETEGGAFTVNITPPRTGPNLLLPIVLAAFLTFIWRYQKPLYERISQ